MSEELNLESVVEVREEIADNLDIIANNLEANSLEGLEIAIADLKRQSSSLRNGVFRILVLGDVKRGKSTVINALIGEDLLPRDVNACTAILTVLRYGTEKKVTVHFKDDTPAAEIDFETFKQDYTVSVDEAKQLETSDELAFPNVEYAAIEYPLALLESGVEIIDSPGLNDTQARNELSLSYIYNCQAILFVMRAVQPVTLEEKRYLNNFIKDRGLSVFFLINGWDEIGNELLDPEDPEVLEAAITRSQEYFQTQLTEYLPSGINYDERVFELSALNVLRARLKGHEITDDGYNNFTNTLNNFLTQERAVAEFQPAKILAEQAYNRLNEITSTRIPLLENSEVDLQQKIAAIEPEFKQLEQLGNRFKQDIARQRETTADAIADSFEEYVLKLESTFLSDFSRYEPKLDAIDFLIPGKRDEFYRDFKRAFDSYITDKLAQWEKEAETDLENAFTELLVSAKKYSRDYHDIVELINTKLIGRKIIYLDKEKQPNKEIEWKNWTIGCLALASGNIAGIALAGAGFKWQSVLINWLSVFGISRFITLFTGVMLGPYGVLAVGLGIAGIQASFGRQDFMRYVEQEFVKYLPKIAQEQKAVVRKTVAKCFQDYQQEIVSRIDRDLKSRRLELDNLVQQQSLGTEQKTAEVTKLKELNQTVLGAYQRIDALVSNE